MPMAAMPQCAPRWPERHTARADATYARRLAATASHATRALRIMMMMIIKF